MPHITASLLIIADREYLRFYRRQQGRPLIIIGVSVELQPALFLLNVCSMAHYYLEGRVWKGSDLHRRALS